MQFSIFKKNATNLLILLVSLLSINMSNAQNNFGSVSLKNKKGNNVILDSLLQTDKPIVISFWATWCSPCISELDNINEDLEVWEKETGLKLYAVTIDDSRSQSSALGLAKGKGWDIEILFDTNQDLKRALNVANIPHVFVFYKGKIVYQKNGFTPGSEKKLLSEIKKIIAQP